MNGGLTLRQKKQCQILSLECKFTQLKRHSYWQGNRDNVAQNGKKKELNRTGFGFHKVWLCIKDL